MRSMRTPGGRMLLLLILSTSASTPLRVGMVSAPRRISIDALHDVVVVVLAGDAEPRLVANGDIRHIGDQHRRPPRTVSMVLRMSSIERIWPTLRTIADCEPMFTVLAPTLMLALFRPSST